jgi:excinuclease ABC subunit A
MSEFIRIINASENNLRSVSVEIPRNKLVVVTGISGSGKSSLIFDVLYREAEYRYLGSFSSYARQFLGRMKRPDVELVEGLSPAIIINQQSAGRNVRSTVGTITEIYDYLRLLFARTGKAAIDHPGIIINRSLFSFNSPAGACPACKGLGVEDRLDPDLLVADETKSLRDRALVITAPNGYIIYSQVTMEVLDQVCRSEGFNVDIPWKALTPAQKHIVLFGSDKIEIPYGKHTLESRMRWSGITAKPREMGYYKGILPVMETILKRERNKNIMRFVRSGNCSVCNGSRLNEDALSVRIDGMNIAEMSALQLDELSVILENLDLPVTEKQIAEPVINAIVRQVGLLTRLGLGYLTTDRVSTSLSGGEIQRMRLAAQAGTGLSGILYILDEPSAGLHPRDTLRMIRVLEDLRDMGNTVIVVEHEEEFIRHADWLIDIGPGAGTNGGEILLSIPAGEIENLPEQLVRKSRTLSFLKGIERVEVSPQRHRDTERVEVSPQRHRGTERIEVSPQRLRDTEKIEIFGATHHNLKNINVSFLTASLNVVTGISGAGKSTLVNDILGNFLRKKLHGSNAHPGSHKEIKGWENISKVISIDQSPIGRTPRSNPATYTGLSDLIRDLFAGLPEAIEKSYGKSRFSFNTEGGRCDSCSGAGYLQIGMHFMGNAEVLCEKCEGRRFNDETLGIKYRNRNISEVLELTVSEALEFFSGQPGILRFLNTLDSLGLGYLTLGQRSSTISGGEAQRVKLASELSRPQSSHTLYLLDEPTTGLHAADVSKLLLALNNLVFAGNTVIVIEHHLALIAAADHVIDLGPESGHNGGCLIATGTPAEVAGCEDSWTGQALKGYFAQPSPLSLSPNPGEGKHAGAIRFKGVTTNNLRNIDVSFPAGKITVVTGISGSGKSSLAFDTLHAEGMNRYMESFSTYVRTQVGIREKADFEEVSGLTATLAVDQRIIGSNPRSTVGTMTGIYDFYRLLFSRVATSGSGKIPVLSSLFSFNHQHGACPACGGLGYRTVCDPEQLITDPELPLPGGAINGTKTGKFYGDPYGQYIATLKAAGKSYGMDFTMPWQDLPESGKEIALYGTGNDIYDVSWEYKRDKRTGEHHFKGKWIGLANLVNEEYHRKHADHRGDEMLALMKRESCGSCHGKRLCEEALSYQVAGMDISSVSSLTISDSIAFFTGLKDAGLPPDLKIIAIPLISEIITRLNVISELGLPYISIDRSVSSLSGGETQRIKLAGQTGSGLTGITYVLDEPTIGLHSADVASLMKILRRLKDSGNTVVIVEHDREVILSADHVIELGPGAGTNGGLLLSSGTPEEIISNPGSLTGKYLTADKMITGSRVRADGTGLSIQNATANNLKGFDLDIPGGGIIVITGVSGSGKSTLLYDVILSSWEKGKPCGCSSLAGLENYQKVVAVHQRPSFTGPAGVPATYTGIFDQVRELFAKTGDAVLMNFRKGHFSFNGKEGRCDQCDGAGKIKISMDFISDVHLVCEKCNGKRYKKEVLACQFNGRNIADVLEMTFSEAAVFFHDLLPLAGQLEMMEKVGLGYLKLGQPLDTLSGGETQRLNLAAELMKPVKGRTLYLFEEPATGLHFKDIEYLMKLFHELAGRGHTLLVIEHDPDVILNGGWIIDLGPSGGDEGGYLVAQGTVKEIMNNEKSITGRYLKTLITNYEL